MSGKWSDFFCNPKTAAKNAGILLVMVFLIVYAGFQILPSFAQKLETETALPVSIYNKDVGTGYIFRDEFVIPGGNGVLSTLVKDGERVSKGQHFANIYTADMAHLEEKISEIDKKIEILEKSSVEANAYITDLSKTDAQIDNSFDELYLSVAKGDLSGLSDIEKDLLVGMNKRELIVDITQSYSAKIASLMSERSVIENRISAYSDKLFVPESGYYFGDADGYENVFNISDIENITLERFDEITSSTPDERILSANYGKIVTSYVWYTVLETDKNTASRYSEGNYYNLIFPSYSEERELQMKLEKMVKNTSSGRVLLLFRGNTAPEDFPYTRCDEINIISEKCTGLSVPKEALRVVDGLKGVYIIDGDIVRFRLVEILGENDGSYIVNANSQSESDVFGQDDLSGKKVYRYISLYDNVIVSGKDLFDGKIVY